MKKLPIAFLIIISLTGCSAVVLREGPAYHGTFHSASSLVCTHDKAKAVANRTEGKLSVANYLAEFTLGGSFNVLDLALTTTVETVLLPYDLFKPNKSYAGWEGKNHPKFGDCSRNVSIVRLLSAQ